MHNKVKHRDVFFVAPVAPQKNTRVLAALDAMRKVIRL